MELNTESVLLKGLLTDGLFFGKIVHVLQRKYFTELGSQILFDLTKKHYLEYKKIPNLTELVGYLQEVPNQEARNSAVEAIKFVHALDTVENTEYLLDTAVTFVKNAIFTEALILGSDALQEKNEEKIQKSKLLMEEMSKVSISSDLGLDFDDIETMIEYYQNELIGILTQHKELNKRLGTGFLPGTLSIIMAASGVGKSLLMTDLISGHIKEGKNVLLVSMEMQDREIMKRVHANALDLNINRLTNFQKNNGYSPDEIKLAKEKIQSNGKFFVKDYPTGSFSPLMLDNLLDEFEVEKGIKFDIIYLDYLGIMKSDLLSPSAGLYSYVKSIVEETRSIATKRAIPIISASQLNRSATGNSLDIKNVGNDSVSDSLGTVQTADFIMFLLQTEEMKEQKLMTCKVTKNRFNGRTDHFNMNIDYLHMRFSDAIVQDGGMTEKEVEKEIKTIRQEDIQKIKKHDNSLNEEFDVMAELGLS